MHSIASQAICMMRMLVFSIRLFICACSLTIKDFQGRGLVLCCLMTPGISKDIRCRVWPYFLKLTYNEIGHQATQWSGLSAWCLHMVTSIFLWGVSEYIWSNILSYDPGGGKGKRKDYMQYCFAHFKENLHILAVGANYVKCSVCFVGFFLKCKNDAFVVHTEW